ncbi:hypothetical protein GCM10025868_23440 [Angustibacter aerolatus]|uniref:Major facilitator superfamily (MFS) profile domain-containing protein n=1 Tax=Angustibacter aerolatus TaxID=1162965 RepID=A0ABQ6JJ12_9ACTN|nr:hypothetical protein [Angustibacter aerolatus]GMA87094.1 hypothetical protein GCM10025868_23440 [Angustibacter aerolatus]
MSFVADLRTVLRGRDFRRLFAVRLTSQAGDGVFQVGLASLVFFSPERAATAQAAAAAFAVSALPYTLIGPWAGVLLDRWPRQRVLLWSNAVRALMVLGVAAVVVGRSVGPTLYLSVLACLSVNRFFLAGLGASLPRVVPRHEPGDGQRGVADVGHAGRAARRRRGLPAARRAADGRPR